MKPWQQRSWILPRDPTFAAKAAVVLDLYARRCDGGLLHPGDFVICADEKSQLQALGRRDEAAPAGPGRPALVEFECRRGGALAYLAAWDVHHARLFDRFEPRTGIEPFGRLVGQVMASEPYRSARRVFWIVDNGSSRAGRASVERMQAAWANTRLIHLPIHASWLNQIELFFSIVQRKGADPRRLRVARRAGRAAVGVRRALPPSRPAVPLDVLRADLDALLARLARREPHLRVAA